MEHIGYWILEDVSTNSGMGFVPLLLLISSFPSNGIIKNTTKQEVHLPSLLLPATLQHIITAALSPPPSPPSFFPPVHWPLSKCVFASPSEARCVSATWPQANSWPVVHSRKDKAGDLYRLSSPLTALVPFPTSRRCTFYRGGGCFCTAVLEMGISSWYSEGRRVCLHWLYWFVEDR